MLISYIDTTDLKSSPVSSTSGSKMLDMQTPLHILIVAKPRQREAARLAEGIALWLEERGCTTHIVEAGGDASSSEALFPADLVVVLGGDGTMLEVARSFVAHPVPLTGINFGKVGFLAELSIAEWKKGLETFLTGKADLLRRMALHWRVLRDGREAAIGMAVNDVVISRGALSRVITLDISVDEQKMCRVRADGLIISSPLGVSGYAVSAGGPLIHPELDVLTVTPICPFLCNFPPVVLPYPMTVRAAIQPEAMETYLTIDGQQGVPLEGGDCIEVQGVPGGVHFARLRPNDYFQDARLRAGVFGKQ